MLERAGKSCVGHNTYKEFVRQKWGGREEVGRKLEKGGQSWRVEGTRRREERERGMGTGR